MEPQAYRCKFYKRGSLVRGLLSGRLPMGRKFHIAPFPSLAQVCEMPHTLGLMVDARRLFVWLAALGIFGAAIGAQAQNEEGYIDTTFTAQCLGNTSPRALAVQFDGKIIAGGTFFQGPGVACVNAIDRMGANGAVDVNFNSPFLAGSIVNAIQLQGNKILVAGWMQYPGVTFPLARLNANGTLDNTFARAIENSAIVFNAMVVQPDGSIIVAGDADVNIPAMQSFGFIERVNANGVLDNSFPNGAVTPRESAPLPIVAALARATDGKIYVGGAFTVLRGLGRLGLGRLNANGTLDTNYVADINGVVRALLIQPDGKVLVAGNFIAGGLGQRTLARLNSNGTLDSSFQILNGGGGLGLSLLLQPNGKIILGHSFGVMRLETNGLVDIDFGPRNAANLLGTEADNVTALAFTANSNLVVGASRVADTRAVRQGVTRLFAFVPPLPPRPVITSHPMSQIVESGSNVTFSVVATGAPPITYQWFKEGTKLKNATNNPFTINGVNSTHAGNYRVVASNVGGSSTSTVAHLTVNFNTSPLTIITNGQGVVLPDLTKNELEIGRTYTITARPAAGHLFSNWLGGATSTVPVLTFTMQSNLVLIVNFVPSPFVGANGVYNGLFYDTAAPSHHTAGAISVTLDEVGGVRGSVRRGTKTRKFKSAFAVDRTATITLPATATDAALTLALEVDVVNAIMNGSVTFASNFSTNTATLLAHRNPFSSSQNPAPTSGRFNAAIPGIDDAASAPAGDGFLPLTVSTAGRVAAKGALADGSAVKVTSATSVNGLTPVYTALYTGRGSIFGWLTISNTGINDVSGTLHWIKPGTVGGTYYPAGFSNAIDVIGSIFRPVSAGTPVLNLTDDQVIVSHGNLPEPFTNSVTLGGDNKISGDNQLALTLSPSKGTVTGSFVDPLANKKRTVKGIVLPLQNQARGFFLGTTQGGRVFVGDAP